MLSKNLEGQSSDTQQSSKVYELTFDTYLCRGADGFQESAALRQRFGVTFADVICEVAEAQCKYMTDELSLAFKQSENVFQQSWEDGL